MRLQLMTSEAIVSNNKQLIGFNNRNSMRDLYVIVYRLYDFVAVIITPERTRWRVSRSAIAIAGEATEH